MAFGNFEQERASRRAWCNPPERCLLIGIRFPARKISRSILPVVQCSIQLKVAKHQKPRNITRNWMRYTFGAVGFSMFSLWLLHHIRLGGSSDIDDWILEAKGSIISFLNDRVEQPAILLPIRDELFETFRKRHRGVSELEEVHSNGFLYLGVAHINKTFHGVHRRENERNLRSTKL